MKEDGGVGENLPEALEVRPHPRPEIVHRADIDQRPEVFDGFVFEQTDMRHSLRGESCRKVRAENIRVCTGFYLRCLVERTAAFSAAKSSSTRRSTLSPTCSSTSRGATAGSDTSVRNGS